MGNSREKYIFFLIYDGLSKLREDSFLLLYPKDSLLLLNNYGLRGETTSVAF